MFCLVYFIFGLFITHIQIILFSNKLFYYKDSLSECLTIEEYQNKDSYNEIILFIIYLNKLINKFVITV